MKNLNFILIALMVFISSAVFAQTDNFNYQAALRDASGDILQNQSVSIVFSIRKGSASGTEVYAESHSATTNDQGLVNLSIGSGTLASGSFSAIDWSSSSHFLKVTVNGTDMGASKFLSVPYANYAKSAGSSSCCGFRASDNATQQIIPAASQTKINYTTEKYDDGGNYNSSNSTYTAPSDGLYHFDCSIGLDNTEYKYLYLSVNGLSQVTLAENRNGYYQLSLDLMLNAGDEVAVGAYVFTSPSTVIWNGTGSNFSGHKVY